MVSTHTSRFRAAVMTAAAVVATAVATGPTLATPAYAESTVTCDYHFTAWRGGFTADLIITNNGPAIDGWVARWSFASPTVLGTVWSAIMFEPEPGRMVATNLSYNGLIPSGGSIGFGWTALAPSTEAPTDITVNGMAC